MSEFDHLWESFVFGNKTKTTSLVLSSLQIMTTWLIVKRVLGDKGATNTTTFSTSQASKLLESIQRSCLYDVYNQRYHTQMCLTFIFKVNHQGQVTDFGSFGILDIVNVRIDTKIEFVACIQPELRKIIQWMRVTLSSKVNRRCHVIFLNIIDIPDLENARIDIKINFVLYLQPEGDKKGHAKGCLTLIFKVMQ